MKIYLVIGQTGEYDDKQDWNVKAFRSRAKAERFQALCNDAAAGIEKDFPYFEPNDHQKEDAMAASPDPYMSMDYTGTTYYVSQLEYVS